MLVTFAVAARLLVDLTTAKALPIFRCYLLAFCVALALRWNTTADAVMVVIVLVLKIAATAEMAWLLCRHMERRRSQALWGCALLLGLVGWLAASGFAQQGNLAYPIVWYVKRSLQLVMAIFLSTIVAFQWKYYPSPGNAVRRYGVLLAALWWDYVGGLLAPRSLQQWQLFGAIFYVSAILIMLLWILAVRANSSETRQHPLRQPIPY